MSLQHLSCEFLAPVPVGHQVALEYSAVTRGGQPVVDRRWFFVVDLTAGIRYGSQYAYGSGTRIALDPDRRVVERFTGVVRACEVSSLMGSENQDVWTLLTIEFPDAPR